MNQGTAKDERLDFQSEKSHRIEKIKKLLSRSNVVFVEILEEFEVCLALGYLERNDFHNIFEKEKIWWDKIHGLTFLTPESRRIIKIANSNGLRIVGLEAAVTISRIKSNRAQEKVARCAVSSRYITRQQVVDCVDEFRMGIRTFRLPKGMDPSEFSAQDEIPLEEFCLATAQDLRGKVVRAKKLEKPPIEEVPFYQKKRKEIPLQEKKVVGKIGKDLPDKFKSESFLELKKLLKSFSSHYLDVSSALIRCIEEEKIGKEELSKKIKMGPKRMNCLISLRNFSPTVSEKIRRSFRFSDCPFFSLEAASDIASLETEEDQLEAIQYCLLNKLKRNIEVEVRVEFIRSRKK